MLRGERQIPVGRSLEYGADIIEALECDRTATIYGNVLNDGSIDNLPGGCVEVECRVDRDGIHAQRFGRLPEQLAGLNRSHMAVHELVVEALVERSKEKARYALMLDPLTAAICSLDEIARLFDEMWEAERESMPAFS